METGTATVNMNGARVHVVKVLIGQIAQRVTQQKGITMNITKNDKERLLEYHRIAVESKAIIEGIQKTLGVFTTTEALQKIAALEAVAEAARKVVFEYWESPESTPSKANIAMKDLVDMVDELKKVER